MRKFTDKELLRTFKELGIIIVGPMTQLRSGLASPIYVDLRAKVIENPELLWALGRLIVNKIIEVSTPGKKQIVIAVPDAANPMAVAASLYAKTELGIDIRIIVLRKEPKDHGTQKGSLIIGNLDPDAEYTLIDDVVTSNASLKKALDQLKREGIEKCRIIVVVDREQGGKKLLEKEGYEVHAIFEIIKIADQFLDEDLITKEQYEKVVNFIANNQFS